jgi:cytochrome c oxidase subunit 1
MVQSWREGPRIDSADPWNLEEESQFTRDWQWFRDQRSEPPVPDGGSEEEPVTDGGTETDDA